MAKIVTEKQVNAFVKGLITEASPLTYPENASIEEENFNLEINGSRSRRLGMDYEVGYQLNNTGLSANVLANTKQSSHIWPFPGGSSTVSLGVIRIYDRLYFVNLLESNPSAKLKNGGNFLTIPGLLNAEVQATVVNGFFVLTSTDLPLPAMLTYNKDTDVVTFEPLNPLMRDFSGVDDDLAFDFRPAALTDLHKYNLMNQGWSARVSSVCGTGGFKWFSGFVHFGSSGSMLLDVAARAATTIGALECTKTQLGVYPSNADVWTLGKNESAFDAATTNALGLYNPTLMQKATTFVAVPIRGSHILSIFNRGRDRAAFAGIPSLPLDKENGAISTVAAFAGRIFYSGILSTTSSGDKFSPNYAGYIFFSQIVNNKEKLNYCYQENDPTSPDMSDILDTDGGTIHIPEAAKITKLVPIGSSLLVFATNGVWEIAGDALGFLATAYKVTKVTAIGALNPETIVSIGDSIVYWASTGIHTVNPDPTTGRYAAQNISLSTIQTIYNAIPDLGKLNAKGFFDEKLNTIRWLYNDTASYSETNYINDYTKELNLSLSLKAFYSYTIAELAVDSPHICGYVPIPGYSLTDVNFDVAAGADPVILPLDTVIITGKSSTTRSGTNNYLTMKGSSFTLSKYSNSTFKDWVTADTVGVNYVSYIITGYELLGDISHTKQVPYIVFYFNRTEDGFSPVGGTLVLDNQSGCLVQAQWDWCNSATSGKWGAQFQAYRLLRPYVPSGAGDTFDYGEKVITTKNKLRGSGRAISLKIQSEAGKDMKLLGWSMDVTAKSKV